MTPRILLQTSLLTVAWASTGCAAASRGPVGDLPRFSAESPLPVVGPDQVTLVRRVAPRFPPEERSRGIEASLIVAFVVDTLGRVDPRSVAFLSAVPSSFRGAVCEFLRQAQYQPIGAPSPRRTLVVSDFVFALEGGALWGKRGDYRSHLAQIADEPWTQTAARLESAPQCG
jgi:hypothetical protein